MNSYSTSLLLINQPCEDERLSWPCWLTYSGRFTHINGYPSAAGQVQKDIIIGNVPGVCDTDAGSYKEEGMRCGKHTSTNETKVTHGVVSANDKVKIGTRVDHSRNKRDGSPLEQVAAVQTRAVKAKEKLPPKSLKIKTVPGLSLIHI